MKLSKKRASKKRLIGIKNSWKYEKDFNLYVN